MMNKITREETLKYHELPTPGKIEILPTKPYKTQKDLSMAYSPGVAFPCEEIEANPSTVYDYTDKGNLVAVITNGTAVLGLGSIGALASKPVMEGKAMLFKIYAGLDAFDIEVDERDPQKFIEIVKAISGTFGGINLEDIKAPECFEIERKLKEICDIPVMHDDQHGTAIISGAALLNAAEIQGKRLEDMRLVINGAGSAALSCAHLYLALGMRRENIIMVDSKGVIKEARKNLNEYKKEFTCIGCIQNTLEEALVGADMFLGLSVANVLTPEMIQSMAPKPIIFALANPDPEIEYEKAINAVPDLIMASGRSDYPNQVNNVLGFPYIFRGALDCSAKEINEDMKLAACKAIASLAKEPVPESVKKAYDNKDFKFGRCYILPKPNDPRLLAVVAPAVAAAAIKSGVARKRISDFEAYKNKLNALLRHVRDEAEDVLGVENS